MSGVDREAGVFVIKPSGVPYEDLTIDDLVTVRLSDGEVVDGRLRPSTDTETHRCLYLAFPSIGGVTHTHSTYAVAFAQARRDIPVLGTTHADTFNGPVPCTPDLTADQCAKNYEFNTGRVIVDMLQEDDQRAAEVPASLVAGHGPFMWGTTARKSLEHASSARPSPTSPSTPSPWPPPLRRPAICWTVTTHASTDPTPTTAIRPPLPPPDELHPSTGSDTRRMKRAFVPVCQYMLNSEEGGI